ncbi:MAG: tRNA (adenosine(37)-N6)-threonylcarbamoyltransferase complex ATPase subunit type 1 TsaE [Firmicutes bacterium]|nr:tRNA (adenosine(37)-N6)-threonylcarbamoyltransferase complex ATPase subunit type 1 TsaE [Bacillota bacterium]
MEERNLVMRNEADTASFGRELAKNLQPGTVIALIGDLGTGKTTLTKAIAEGLGVTDTITSPTFNIVKEYTSGRLPLYHFDVYRVGDVDEMFEIGVEEYFYGQGVCVVEWADLIEEIMPEDTLFINIEHGADFNERIYTISGGK